MATPTDAGLARGTALRQRRLALGKSLEEVAAATRIPLAHLAALEEGRLDALPDGPYSDMYHREVSSYLGDPDGALSSPRIRADGGSGAPLGVVRGLAVISILGLVAVLALAAWPVVSERIEVPSAETTEQELVIVVREPTQLHVVVDGVPRLDGAVSRGEELRYVGSHRIEVEVVALEHVRLIWNRQRVVPQGLQDAPRRLVFEQDVGGAP
ncbi:MAG: helix-turn-helix domain-containing protein [Myxococcales bacterium]|nr:helix-turn-helix domain-containing protein [Myxococcales bacterium]